MRSSEIQKGASETVYNQVKNGIEKGETGIFQFSVGVYEFFSYYSTVTDLAKLRGLSTSKPRCKLA